MKQGSAGQISYSEEHWRAIFNATNEAIFIHDADTGKILDVNETFQKMYGYTRDEISDLSVPDLSSQDEKFNEMQAMELLKKTSGTGPQVFEWHARKKSGELFWVEVSLHFYEVGEEGRVIAVVRDISFRKDAQGALMESEKKYRTLFENANDSIFLMNRDNFLECNTKTLEIFGCSKEDIIGKSPVAFSPEYQPDGRMSSEKARDKINRAYKGEPQFFEWKHMKLDGTLFDAEVSLNLISLPDQEILQALVRDVTDRKQAEQALRDSEEKYRMLIENVPSVFWISDITGKTLYISPNVSRVYGFSPDEICQGGEDLWLKRVHEADLEDLLNSYRNLYEKGEPYRAQYRIKHKNGKWIWLFDVGELYHSEKGEKVAYGVFTDITMQKETERALKESEEKFSKAFRTNPAMMSLIDLETHKRVDVNEAFLKSTGYTRDEIVGKTVEEIRIFADKLQFEKLLANLMEKGFLQPVDADILTKDGHIRNTLVSAEIITIAATRMVLLLITDITERKETQKKLKESEEYYRSLYENISDGIFIINVLPDKKFELAGFNPAQEKILNITAEMVRSKPLSEFLSEGIINRLVEGFKSCIREKKAYSYDEEEFQSGGEIRYHANTLVPLISETGEVYRIIGVTRDMTEKKQAQQKIYNLVLHAEEKERSRIAKELHDGLGPILSTIKLYVDWLLDPNKKTDNQPIVSKIDSTLNEAMRGLKEISNNLSPHILQNYGLTIALNNFIEKIGDPGDLKVEFNSNVNNRLNSTIETTVYRILTECLNNTLKYAKARKVVITIEEDVENVSFVYSDDGLGFDAKYTLENKKGMGLINMKNRMEMIGGRLDIESTAGTGTRISGNIKTTQFF